MSKLILHSNYTNGVDKVQLNDIVQDDCFVMIDSKLIRMKLENFLVRFKLCL